MFVLRSTFTYIVVICSKGSKLELKSKYGLSGACQGKVAGWPLVAHCRLEYDPRLFSFF